MTEKNSKIAHNFCMWSPAVAVLASLALLVMPDAVQPKPDAATLLPAPPYVEKAVDGWFPWETQAGTMESGLSQAEFDKVLTNRAAIETILRRSRALTGGAEVRPSWTVARRKDPGDPRPARYGMNLMVFRPSKAVARTAAGHITIGINQPYASSFFGMGSLLFSDAEGPIYHERPVIGEAAGLTRHRLTGESAVTQRTGWIMTPDDRPLWLPVSRERWIRALIYDARGKLEEFEKKAREEAQKRREGFDRMYEFMKKISEENAEELRRQHEEREDGFARIAESLAAGDDADALEKLGRRDLALYLRAIAGLEEELEALPPDERVSPAYCCEWPPVVYFAPPLTPARPSLLVEPCDERARPLLAPNPEFFRSDLPPTAMQSITVVQSLTRADSAWEDYMEAVRTDVDWEAVKALLR